MGIKELEQVSHANQILDGLRDLCVVLQNPGKTDITASILTVIEVGLDKAQSLLKEAMDSGNVKVTEGGGEECKGQ